MKRTLSVGLLLVLATSCTAYRRAQVLVTIDAEPGVDELSNTVLVRVWGRGENESFDDTEIVASEPGSRYPWTVALYPRDDDTSRFFRFEAVAVNGAGDAVATARLISGYERGQVLHVYLLLQDSCIGVPCEDLSSTCRNGACVDIPEEPTVFDPDAGFPDSGSPACAGPPEAEACNREDDDCDGRIDEAFDLLADESNCGACGRSCDPAHAVGVCESGSCAIESCDSGWDDCNGMVADGCEADLGSAETCGDCKVACSAPTPNCAGGTCVDACPSGTMLCGASCVDTNTSTEHCGACDTACAVRSFVDATCAGGTCTYECQSGHDSCNGPPGEGDADGCEQDVDGDAANCSACGIRCSGDACNDPVCTSGVCGTRPVMDGRSCTNGDACPGDTCVSGACRPAVCSDAGMDAGRDAGRDAASDAGGCTSCVTGQFCCGTSCCPIGYSCAGGICAPPDAGPPPDAGSCGGTTCLPGYTCCDDVSCCAPGEVCSAGVCEPPDAGGGICGACPSDCCGGVTCCDASETCCGTWCCPSGDFCGGMPGSCVSPDAGSPSPCGSCTGGICCETTFAGFMCCSTACEGGAGCTTGVTPGDGGAVCSPSTCAFPDHCCSHGGTVECCAPGETCYSWGCGA